MSARLRLVPVLVLLCVPLAATAKPRGKTQLQLAVKPAGAQLFIDGKPMGKVGENRIIDVTPGFHVIHVVNKGDEHEERVNFEAGRKTIYTFEFDDVVPANPAEPAPPPIPDDDLERRGDEKR